MARKVVVVGGGVGGLATALELRRHGYDVTVCERHTEIGGKASQRVEAGFRWDEGPSIIVLNWVYRELFKASGLDPDAYLTMRRLDPAFRVVLSDGTAIDVPAGEAGLASAFGAIEPADGEGLHRFMKRVDKFARRLGHSYCDRIIDGWSKVFFSRLMLSAATISPNLGYAALLDQYFRSPRVHELLYGFPTFSGFEPRTAPASLAIIPWTIIREGVWYPVGGVHAIPLAIARACRERGVDIQTQTDVERIELDSTGQVRGVATSAGFIDAKIIVSNCDLVPTYQMLHGGRGFTPEVEALRAEDADPAVSFFTLQLGCNRTWPNLKHHLLVLTKGSEHVYQELFVRKEYPADPPIYVNTTSDTDPQDAIPGGCNPFIVISVPALDPAHPLPADFQERFAEKILNRLEEAGLPGLRESIQTMTITGPADWQKKFLSFRGSIYGLSPKHNVLQGSFRPINYRPDIPGLYLVGGSVQPGPGLPMVVQGGKITAARIARAFPAGR